jgi:putative tryptophan/tyrosine transport system substrate-binding protein
MRRREFISLLCGAVAAWPLTADAQRQAMVVVGFLTARSPGEADHLISAFRQGLEEAGYVEGGNIQVEYRWAEGRNSRLPALARDLVRRRVAVIAATGTPPTLAAKAATDTIPIVFSVAVDPVKIGLVASLSRPGRNATGVAQFSDVLATKHLELLTDLVPSATVIGFLVDPNYPDTEARSRNVEQAGILLGRRVVTLNASDEREIDKAFMALIQQQIRGLLVDNVALLNSHRDQIVTLAHTPSR